MFAVFVTRQAVASRTLYIRTFQKWNKARHRNVDMKALNAALKPFFFLVHPDLFGNFPEKRKTNEDSLMILNSFLQESVGGKVGKQTKEMLLLKFYIRDPKNPGMDSVSEISVNLQRISPIVLIEKLLKSAGLPGLENIEAMIKVQKFNAIKHLDDIDQYDDHDLRYNDGKKYLARFFEQKFALARTRLKDSQKLRHQNVDLIENICKDFGMKSLIVESNWTVRLLHGYLKNVYECLRRNKDEVRKAAGWHVALTLWNGIDADGTVHLNIEDEPLSWVKLLSSVQRFAVVLQDTKYLTKDISEVLGGLRICKAVYGMKHYHLDDFHKSLKCLMLKLEENTTKIDLDLSGFNAMISVRSEEKAVVQPNGSFLLPLSMSGLEIISFLKNSFGTATDTLHIQQRQQMKEQQLIEHCIAHLGFRSLTKTSDINHSQMISCCEIMVDVLDNYLTKNLQVKVGQHYHISTDGDISIPWNWRTI